MTGWVGLGSPEPLRRYAQDARTAARTVPAGDGPHTPIDAGPDGLLAPVAEANDRAHARWAGYAAAARPGLGGMAYAADFIAVKFPEVDAESAADLRGLGWDAMTSSPPR